MPLRPREINDSPSKDAIESLIRTAVKREIRRLNASITVLDHGGLTGLGDDDHTQYALADKSRPSPWVAAGDLASLSIADLGTKDHDLLDGLGDDDHTQYLLIDGTRAMTGTLDLNNNRIDLDTDADTSFRTILDDIITIEIGGIDSIQISLDSIHGMDPNGPGRDLTVRGGNAEAESDGGDLILKPGKLDGIGADGGFFIRDPSDNTRYQINNLGNHLITALTGIDWTVNAGLRLRLSDATLQLVGIDLQVGIGNRVLLDDDSDTHISAIADDLIFHTVGGTTVMFMTATSVSVTQDLALVQDKRLDLDADADTSIRASADDLIDFEVGGTDVMQITPTILDLKDLLLSNIGGDHRLVKDADESRTNDTSLSDDNTLVTPTLELNTQYIVTGVLIVETASTTPDIKFTFTLPTSSTDIQITTLSYRADGTVQLRDADIITSSGGGPVVIGLDGAGINDVIEIRGSFKTAGSAGTCDLQWAQRVSDATPTILKAGSYLHVLRVT